jgi:hypothetical protein
MKPQTLDGYHADFASDCERMLVTLLRGLGPWKDSIVLWSADSHRDIW